MSGQSPIIFHEYLRGRERRPVAEALRSFDDNPYISPSLYYMQLERYLQYFPYSGCHIDH